MQIFFKKFHLQFKYEYKFEVFLFKMHNLLLEEHCLEVLIVPTAGGVGNAFPVGETTFLYLTNPCSIATCHIELPPPQAFCCSFLSTSLGIKYSLANPAFFFLPGTQGENIFRFFMCPDQKRSAFQQTLRGKIECQRYIQT